MDTHTYGGRWAFDAGALRTTWRYWDTWQTEIVRLDSGELVRVDPFKPFDVTNAPDGQRIFNMHKVTAVIGSAFAPGGWQEPDFDDSTPLQLRMVSDWVAPNPQDFNIHIGMLESPDSIAMQYDVPMWSDKHLKLLDRTFELMGEMCNRELYIPLITKTQLGNEHSMVRWIRQGDGSCRYDFSIAEKYLDLAIKRHGRIGVVGLYIHDVGFGNGGAVHLPSPSSIPRARN